MSSLKERCIHVIYRHSLFKAMHILPVELVDQVFLTLAKMHALTDAHLIHWFHTQLKEFDFSSCKLITDNGIKSFVQRFPFIESLKLGESGVTSQCISHISSSCTQLKSLDLYDMNIKESDFNAMKKCHSLQSLYLKKGNEILKAKPIAKLLQSWPNILSFTTHPISYILLNDLTTLRFEYLRHFRLGVELGDIIFSALPTLKHLSHLYCGSYGRGNSKVTTTSIQSLLENCPTLTALDISGMSLVDICSLRSTKLRSLDVSYTTVDNSADLFLEKISHSFPNLVSLKMLNLVAMKGTALRNLVNNTTLRELDLGTCISLDSGCLEQWGKATTTPYTYSYLSLSGCKDITDASFSKLASVLSADLRTLDLSGVWKLDSSLQIVATQCHYLTSLDLSMCKIMSDKSIISIAKNCPLLRSLELYSCKNVTDDAIIEIADHCPDLTILNLYQLSITDRSVACFGQKLPNLTSLDCSCTNISDESLRSVGFGCPLVYFSAIGCSKLTDQGVIQLVRGARNLQRLVLNECKPLTDASLKEMGQHLPFLRDLSMLGCSMISGEGILELGRQCRVLRTLRLSSGTPITTSQIRSLFSISPFLSLKL